MSRTVLNKRSNVVLEDGSPKIPTADTLNYGEIAINYNAGTETISLKNSNNEIVALSVSQVISDATFNNGHNAVSSVTGIPVSKRLAIATISNNGSLLMVVKSM